MAAPKNPKGGQKNMVKNLEKKLKGELVPPALGEKGSVQAPKKFDTIGDVIAEQMRLYKEVFRGTIAINDLSKLMYSLSQIIQGLKAKSEIDALEDAYNQQWMGVRIIAPADYHDPVKEQIEARFLEE